MDADLLELLLQLRRQLEYALHGQATTLVHDFAQLHGRSVQTVWRWLGEFAGYQTQRKKRSDAGFTKLPEDSLLVMAATKNASVRANGKKTKPTGVAMNIADTNGFVVNVSQSQVNRLMRQRRLDTASQEHSRNHISMRSLYPNHVHQIDPSLCLIYYIGKRQMMMTEAEFNKNKPTAIEKVKLKVWRYVRYDHASGSLDVKYFEAAGENQRSLFEFLLWTWGRQENRLSYGVPTILLWDKGSANTSSGIKNLLNALGVEHQTHATHHAWVKGGVENGNRIVEIHFESRLRDEPVECIEDLNHAAELWVRDYNANLIKHVDSRILRNSGERYVRDDLWSLILQAQEHLKAMPERKVCSWFLTGKEEPRQIRDNVISYVHPEIGKSCKYDLRQWSEFYSQKQSVSVMPVLMANGAIRVEIEQLGRENLIVQVERETEFDAYGRMLSGAIIGEEHKRAAVTQAEQAAKQIAHTAYGTTDLDAAEALLKKNTRPFMALNDGRGLVAHSHLGQDQLPARLLPAASSIVNAEIEKARASKVEHERKNHAAMAVWLRGKLRDEWDKTMLPTLMQRFPDGATEQELESVLTDIKAGRTAAGKAQLKAV